MDKENTCINIKINKEMNLLSLTPEEINVVLSATSAKLNFNTNVVEKDWWVTMVLKALFRTSCADYLTFKGGTSLSKGWGLIERFSEDIDVAFDKSFWGVEGINKSQRDKIRKKTRAYIEKDLLPQLDEILKEMGAKDYELEFVPNENSDKDPTVCFIPYKSYCAENEYVDSRIKIEFSSRSLREPRGRITIRPFVQDVYPEEFADFTFDVYAVVPSRTFLEKVFLLHEELQKNYTRVNRMSRHLYDLSRLMDTPFAEAALADVEMYREIITHRSIFNAIKGIDYSTHHPSTINFIPEGEVYQLWRDDYQKMRSNTFIYGDSLPYEELIEKLKGLQSRIREIKY